MSRKSSSGFITGKPIKPDVAQKGRDYSQTENSQLSDELIRDYILERFQIYHLELNERLKESWSTYHLDRSDRLKGLGQPTPSKRRA